MVNIENGQSPTSLEEVEALIIQLYEPGAPERVAKIQETLQKIQRSPEGWQLATSLLNHKDQRVRFFAALTFIVKLNTDAKSLNDEDAQALLQTLVSWLIQCMATSEGPLVLRKLCSTLVAYFMQFSTSWSRCIKHIMYCICTSQAHPYSSLEEAPDTTILVQNISEDQAVAIFWFAATLVEEVGKTDSNSMKQHKFHRRVIPNVDDIVPMISKYIATNDTLSSDRTVRLEAMYCLKAWVSYSHRAFIDDGTTLEPLQQLMKPAIMCLVDEELYEITVELITDVLGNYSKFLSKENFDLLHTLFNSPWAQERYDRLIQGDFEFESLQFGMFMIAFGDATIQDLTENIETDPLCNQYLSALCGLLGAKGYAVHEDKIYVLALEFWNTSVEVMVDHQYGSQEGTPSWFSAAQAHILQVIERCWRKSQFPPASIYNAWDSVDRTAFKDARRDFSDLLQQFYLTTGIPLLQVFIDLIHKAVETRNWAELEASVYCLCSFPDCVTEDAQRDEYLDKAFTPSVLSMFAQQNQVPTRAMKAFLDLITLYADYFQKRPNLLPGVLNIVFEATGAPSLSKVASRAIEKLCSDCRAILVPELGAFLQHYRNIASNASLDATVKEAVMEGIASIIQAIEPEESKLAPLGQLLDYVEPDVDLSLGFAAMQASTGTQMSTGIVNAGARDDAAASDAGVLALRCLTGIAKGIQVPDDTPVDLEDRESKYSSFWTTGPGSHVQQRIYSMICRVYGALSNRSEIVEYACNILRVGFREMEPGPFVMPPSMTAQFIMNATVQTPRLGHIINTACFLVSSQKWGDGPDEEVLGTLLNWVAQLLHSVGEPGNDPEITQNGIEFLQRLLPKYSQILMGHQPSSSLEYVFMFTLKALAGSDPLPKQAAADFWATFIGLPNQPPELQAAIDSAVQHLGLMLAQALIYNIGGNAARSELDKLSEPVKKLVVRQVHSKNWFEAALLDINFPSDKVTVKDRVVFLQKIMNLRGARGTNQVVRDFWLACRGSNFAYAS